MERMKKGLLSILSILIIVLACAFMGCGQDYSSEERTRESVENKFPEFSYNSDESPYYQKDNHMIAIAENGYYFARNVTMPNHDNFVNCDYAGLKPISDINDENSKLYGKMIYYYDIDSGAVTPLCNNLDCKHDTVECQAYFETVEGSSNGGGFVYYSHRLYMVAYNERSGMTLVSYDEHGKNQKEECVISSDPEYLPYVGNNNDLCIFNGFAYCWGIKNDSSQDLPGFEMVLYRTDLAGGKSEKILTLKETAEEHKYTSDFSGDIEAANNKLYIKTCSYNIDTRTYIYVLYELEGGESDTLKEILCTNVPMDCGDREEGEEYVSLKNFAMDNDGNLYYVDEIEKEEGLSVKAELYKYNLNTHSKEKFYDVTTVGYGVMCDDRYVYLQYYGNFVTSLVVLDRNGNEKYVIKEYKGTCSLAGVDDRYLVIKAEANSNFPSNEKTEEWADCGKYFALEKGTIGTGNEKWIEMYNGMFIQ